MHPCMTTCAGGHTAVEQLMELSGYMRADSLYVMNKLLPDGSFPPWFASGRARQNTPRFTLSLRTDCLRERHNTIVRSGVRRGPGGLLPIHGSKCAGVWGLEEPCELFINIAVLLNLPNVFLSASLVFCSCSPLFLATRPALESAPLIPIWLFSFSFPKNKVWSSFVGERRWHVNSSHPGPSPVHPPPPPPHSEFGSTQGPVKIVPQSQGPENPSARPPPLAP